MDFKASLGHREQKAIPEQKELQEPQAHKVQRELSVRKAPRVSKEKKEPPVPASGCRPP